MFNMMKKNLIISLGLLAILMGTIGCDAMAQNDDIAPSILGVYPANASVNVATDTSIVVTFDMAMDTASCEALFYAYEGDVNGQMGHMMMHQQQTLSGEFSWNDDHTEMTFHPDVMFSDSTTYTFHLEEGMEDNDHDGMTMSGMMGFGLESDDGIICTFSTGESIANSLMNNNIGEM